MNESRRQAYQRILEYGLVAIRDHAYGGRLALCEIEADHIHNLPSLLDESNEARHRFYIDNERGLYLARLKQLGATEYLEWRMIWYAEPWKILASAAGVELAEAEACNAEWLALADQRMTDIKAGKVVGIPAEEALRSLRRLN